MNQLQDTRRQVWISKKGVPSVLSAQDDSAPQPAAGEVRIQVHASGVNFADIMARMGLYRDAPPIPCVVGYEVAGVIDAVGEGVSEFSVGDRVAALTRFGGYASVVVAPQLQVVRLPDNLSMEEGAAIPVNYLTAWLMLVYYANIRKGQRVLIHAAAGGVGQAALQICRHKGAITFGTASAGKHERLRAAGLDFPIDYRNEDFEERVMALSDGQGVHVALDAVGGESFKKSYRCLSNLGRLYVFGASSIATGTRMNPLTAIKVLLQMPRFNPIPLMDDNRGVTGVNLGHLWEQVDVLREMFQEIMSLCEQGVLQPVVDATFPLSRADEAHAYIQDRKNFGKVILTRDL